VRHIRKLKAPDSLVEWIAANKGLPNFEYKYLPGKTKEDLESTLINEQFCLCAYTEIRIYAGRCHIEHMIPQSVCLKTGLPEKTVDYCNVVACYPESPSYDSTVPDFGACFKSDWPSIAEERLFIMPTDPSCEKRIQYLKDGSVRPSDPNDEAAVTTISHLGLDNKKLAKLRHSAIVELFQNVGGKRPTRQSIQNRHRRLMTPKDGKLEQFFSAKRQCLERKIDGWR
jgi:uncharacterized protein (TIGR02646 family)